MQVQRFRNQSVREALAAVREALGPEALVLSTRLVPARGWRRLVGRREVEVTAALTPPVSESRLEQPPHRPVRPPDSSAAAPTAPAGSQEIVARLRAVGVDLVLATEVAAALPPRVRRDTSERVLVEALAGRLAPLSAGSEPLATIEVFVGPPGVGKTTTIAKIAAQMRARHHVPVSLIAADGYRLGAVEQLRAYAEILSVPFHVARTPLDLERAISQGPRPMLVDTAGRSPADRGVRDLFDALSGRPGIRTHLVLAAGTSLRDAERILTQYRAARPTRIVLTKVDETDAIAPLVGLLRTSGVKVSWIGHGQLVPEDLTAASGEILAAAVLGELGPSRTASVEGALVEASCA